MITKKKRRGFTLVELVIVIAVIAILAAVLIPTFTTVINKAKISSGTSNATNLTTSLRTNAAFDGVSYYSSEKVVEIAQEELHCDLKSNVKGYSYWYDISENTVKFTKDSDILAEQQEGYIPKAYAETATYPIAVETLNESKTQFRYIDQSDSTYAKAIKVVKNLPETNGNQLDRMVTDFNTNVKVTEATATSHFANYSPDTTKATYAIYFDLNGALIVNKAVSKDYTPSRIVIQEGTVAVASNVIESVTITITVSEPIVIPDSVKSVEDNAFSTFKAPAGKTLTLIITGNPNISDKAAGEGEDKGIKIETITPSGSTTAQVLSSSQYKVTYGTMKEGVFSDGTSEVVTGTNITLDKSGYHNDTSEKTLVREYLLPEISFNQTDVKWAEINKIAIRSYKLDGLRAYSMVITDINNDTYIVKNIGVITECGVRYGLYDSKHEQIIKLNAPERLSEMKNLSDLSYKIAYQTGSATYVTQTTSIGTKYEVETAAPSTWSAVGTLQSVAFTNNLSTVSLANTANRLNVTTFEIYKSINNTDTLIYAEYYDAK